MSSWWTIAIKDLRLLWRDKLGLFWVLGFPLLMALLFGAIFSGGDGQASALPVAVVDQDGSKASADFLKTLQDSAALKVTLLPDAEVARNQVRQGQQVACITILKGYGKSNQLFSGGEPPVRVGVDPARRAEAAYLQGILTQQMFQQMFTRYTDSSQLRSLLGDSLSEIERSSDLSSTDKQIFRTFFGALQQFTDEVNTGNPQRSASEWQPEMVKVEEISLSREAQLRPRSSFEITFPQAVLWGLMGCAAGFGVGLVQERRMGTYQRLLVAPISRWAVIGGKGLACFLACIGVTLLLLLIGRLIFGVRCDDLPLLGVAVFSCGICFTGLTMLIAVSGKTEQAVAGVGWAVLLVMGMFGGAMVPLFFMPGWMQNLSQFSLVNWGIVALEGAIWRGFSWGEMVWPVTVLLLSGLISMSVGVTVLQHRKG
ncbi:MAG: hypothetical protein HJJLKODD_00446 [Phycisphaerae bacterium]|nr:hypothetical protein [Phycisphaerae bacterium]